MSSTPDRPPALSIIMPMLNAAGYLPRVLGGLQRSGFQDFELLLVDDGSTDGSRELAQGLGVESLFSGGRKGAGPARNVGVEQARAPILVFVDADVVVHEDTLARIVQHFAADPSISALMGAYDEAPAAPGVVSRFRNLLHTHFHRHAATEASTFWTGLGAVRREAFDRVGGFSTTEILEDVEFGVRLKAAGDRILLDPAIQGKHLKDWSLTSMVRTDLFRRGIPWIELALRRDMLRDDLNTDMGQRISVAATAVFLLAVAGAVLVHGLAFAAPAAGVVAALILPMTRIGGGEPPRFLALVWAVGAALALWMTGHVPAAVVVGAVGVLAAVVPPRFEPPVGAGDWILGVALAAALALSLAAMPLSPLVLAAGLAWLAQIAPNTRILALMARRLGPAGLLASLPLLMLYHLCCGLCVVVGTLKHLTRRSAPAETATSAA